jgi:TP901 family phage tail tape measure protein
MALVAEAFVRVRPDLAGFRAELETQLRTAVAGITPPVIPVQTARVVAGAADVAQVEGAARRGAEAQQRAARDVVRANQLRTDSIGKTIAASKQGVQAELQFARAQQAGAGALGRLAAAQRVASAVNVSDIEARRVHRAALEAGNIAVIENTGRLVKNTTAARASAAAELEAARAVAPHAVKLSQLARGAGSAALSFIGLRGAVLASTGSFLAGAAAIAAIGKAISLAASFEQQMNVFRVTAQATDEQMQAVAATAKQLGEDISLPGVSAVDAAQALTNLTKAGLDVQQSIEGTRGVLQLATAANIDNASAVNLAAGALNAFGLGGDQAVHVADAFANASIAAQGDISEFGIALQQSAAVASQFGVSLEDTLGLLTLLARNSLRGSDAGTSLRTALLRLAAPSKAARAELAGLGVTIRDAEGSVRPEVFAELGQALERLEPAAQAKALSTIFGQDAIRAAGLLAREGVQGLEEVRAQIARQGTAAEISAAQTKGLGGAVSGLKSNLETLGVTLASTALPALTDFVTLISTSVGGINKAAESVGKLNFDIPFTDTGIVSALKEITLQGNPVTGSVRRVNQAINLMRGDATSASAAIDSLSDHFRTSGRDSVAAVQAASKLSDNTDEFVHALRGEAEELDNLNPRLRANLLLIAELAQRTGELPTETQINIILNNKDVKAKLDEVLPLIEQSLAEAKILGRKEGEKVGFAIGQGVGAGVAESRGQIRTGIESGVIEPLKDVLKRAPRFLSPSERLNINQILAEARGDTQEQLRLARVEEERLQTRIESGGLTRKRRAELRTLLAEATARRLGIEDEIESDRKQIAEEAKRNRERAKTEQDRQAREAKSGRLAALGVRESRLEFALESALLDENIQAARRRSEKLVQFFRSQVANEDRTAGEQQEFAQKAVRTAAKTKQTIAEIRAARRSAADAFALQKIETAQLRANLTDTERDNIAATKREIAFWRKATQRDGITKEAREEFLHNRLRAEAELKALQDKVKRIEAPDFSELLRQFQEDFRQNAPNIQISDAGGLAGLFPVGGRATPTPIAPVATAAVGARDPELVRAINANTSKLEDVRAGIGTTVHVNQTWTGEPVPNRLDAHRRARFGYLAEFD